MAAMTIQANAKKRKEEEESGLDFTDSPSFKSKWNNVARDKLRELTTNKDKNRRSSVSAQEERLIREESLQQQRLERFSTAGPVGKAWHRFTMILDSVSVQSILYLSFVIMFQSLSTSVRNPKEFWLTKAVMDRFVTNTFDDHHNTFNTVRRASDIWDWGNNVLWPGLFGDLGPCNRAVGNVAVGQQHTYSGKGCVDESWPDGPGASGSTSDGVGSTALGIDELVERMDQFDWSEGLLIKQARSGPDVNSWECTAGAGQQGPCIPDIDSGIPGSRLPFGYNWTNGYTDANASRPWEYLTYDEVGASSSGIHSGDVSSHKTYEAGGFIALVIPFFSDTYLPDEQGDPSSVTDFRLYNVNSRNGRTPRYYCLRTSFNGNHVEQLCDPGSNGDGTGVNTGRVRASVEQLWNDLRRGHFLDTRSRLLTITMQLRSNHIGLRQRWQFMFEFTSTSSIIPSYVIESGAIFNDSELDDFITFANVALAMVICFALYDCLELSHRGARLYFSDLWNTLDWINYIIYFGCYAQIRATETAYLAYGTCNGRYVCTQLGYFDDHEAMGMYTVTKTYLAICICIQLFKILKFAAILVPKMGLASAVLRKCAVDLLFFGITFVISMLSFSLMLFVQLGPVIEGYYNQIPAFITLFRALFGDFDLELILDNSSGYLNTLLFLSYLFIAVFIMLSMFLAILAEGQVAVREDQEQKQRWARSKNIDFNEMGILHTSEQLVLKAAGYAHKKAVSLCDKKVQSMTRGRHSFRGSQGEGGGGDRHSRRGLEDADDEDAQPRHITTWDLMDAIHELKQAVNNKPSTQPPAAAEEVPSDKMDMFREMLKMRRELQTLTEALARERGTAGAQGSPSGQRGGGWLGKGKDLPAAANSGMSGVLRSAGAAGSRFLGTCEA